MPLNPFDGPIPGANYTSDTKNYPWHRPPEVSDLDDAIELFSKKITDEEVLPKVITMMEIGLPVVRVADIIVTGGIMAGKWTPDIAIMMAGPATHLLMILGKGYGIKKLNTGLDRPKSKFPTKVFFEEMKKYNEQQGGVAAHGVSESLSGVINQAERILDEGVSNEPAAEVKRGFAGAPNTMSMIMGEGEHPNQQVVEGSAM
jgi:hypothetical protein